MPRGGCDSPKLTLKLVMYCDVLSLRFWVSTPSTLTSVPRSSSRRCRTIEADSVPTHAVGDPSEDCANVLPEPPPDAVCEY